MTACAKFLGREIDTCTRGAGCICAQDRKCNALFRQRDALIAAGKAGSPEYMAVLAQLRDATRARVTV